MMPASLSALPACRGAAVALASLLALAGCATPSADRTQVVSLAPGDLVAVLPAEPGAAPNDHPVDLSPETLVQALGSLRQRREGGGIVRRTLFSEQQGPALRPLFQPHELEQAASALGGAFAHAAPDQDVALRLNQLESAGLTEMLKYSRVSAARLFHRDGRLHVILGSLEVDPADPRRREARQVAKTSAYGIPDARFTFSEEIGSRQQATTIEKDLVLPDGAAFVAPERKDWIALDLGPMAAADATSPPAAPERPPAPVAPRPEPAGQPEPAAAAPAPRVESPEAQAPAPAREPRPAAAPPPAAVGGEELTLKLEQLRDLKQRGLIDETLYREKVRELVDRYLE